MWVGLQEAGLLRGEKEYIEFTTQKSGTIFTTRHLRDLSDEFFSQNELYEKAQRQLVADIVNIAGESI